MATVASFNVALIASTGRFVSAISQAERQWNSFARTVQRQAKQMPKAIQEATPAALTLARHVSRIAAVAGAAISGMGLWGVRLQAQFEQSQIAFETLLGSAEAAQEFLGELEKQARRTPFGFTGLQEHARQLLAFGFTADKVLSMITPIGDAVAAMGGNQQVMEQIIRAIGQMQAKQKIQGEEMLQLTEAGIPAWQMLAEAIGTTVPEAMEMVRKGMISASVGIDAILQGMTKRFGGAMERQSRSILGQWEQFKDSLTTITRGFGADIMRIFGVARALEALNEAVGRFADLVSDYGFIGALSRAFPPWLKGVIVAIAGAIGGALVPVLVSWLIPALKKLTISLWATLRPLLPWMAIGAALAVVVWLLARHWQAAWAAISAATLYAASIVVRGVGMIVSAIALIVPGLRGAAQAIRSWADSLRDAAAGQLSVARSAGSAITAAKGGEQIAQSAQQAAEAQQDLGKATEEAAKAAQSNLQSFDEVHTIQEEMADSPAMEMPAMDLALDPAGLGLADGLGDAFGGLAQQVEETTGRLAQAWQTAVTTITGLWEGLKAKALATFPWLRDVSDGFAKAADWVRDNWSTVGPILEGVAGVLALVGAAILIATSPMAALVAGALLVAGIAALIISNWETVGPFLMGIWQAISPALIAIWEALKSAATTIWNALVATAKVIWEGLKAWWSVWGDNVLAILGAVWNQIVLTVQTATNLVKHIIGLILAVIRGDWEAAWEHVKGIATTVWNFLVGTAQNLWIILQAVWQGIVEGVRLAWQLVQSLTLAVWTALTQWLAGIWQGILNTASAIWQGIQAAIAAWWEAVRVATETVWTALTEWLSSLWTAISDTAAAIWEGICTTISTWWDAIKTTSAAVWQFISAFLTGIWITIKGAADAAWSWITDRILGLAATVRDSLITAWNWTASALANIWNGIKSTAQSVWDGVGQIIRGTINWIIGIINKFIDRWNSIEIRVPSIEIPFVGTVGGFTVSVPKLPRIPMLAEGGNITGKGMALVGEAGPELLELPRGARVTPLSGGGGDLADEIAQAVYQAVIDAMRTVQATTPAGGDREIVLRIDGRALARATLPHVIAEGQRQGLQLVVRPQGV